MKYSRFVELPDKERVKILDALKIKGQLEVKILAYCLMPNHFHLMLRQENDGGITRFVSNFCNSYGKYFNTKYNRMGPLFQGAFKAIRVETDEQLIHLSRYIHLNPVTSFLVKEELLDDYPWSSLAEYLEKVETGITDPSIVLGSFGSVKSYQKFVHDQVDYAQELEKIKDLALED
jgi:putative transposase